LENVNLVELPAYADTLCKGIMRSYEKRFVEREKNIKRASDDLAVVANRLEVSIRNAWGSLDKTTSEQGVRLAQTIREAAQQISKQDIQSEYSGSETFHTTAVEASDKVILAIRKYVPKLHKALKTDIASLNSSITKFEAAINAFGIALDESPGSAIESLKVDIHTLLEKEHTLNELRRERQKIHESATMSLDAEKALLKEQEALLSHEEFRQLLQLQDALQSKNGAIEQLIQPLLKALRKYERTLSDDDKSFDRRVLTRLMKIGRAHV
jgi:tetratricopeptide (TPR) repeat protein